jgi:hypothetical protein
MKDMNPMIKVTQFWVEVPLYEGGGSSEPYTVEPTGLDVLSTDELVLFNTIFRKINYY